MSDQQERLSPLDSLIFIALMSALGWWTLFQIGQGLAAWWLR